MSAHTKGCGCCLEPVNDATESCDLCSEATGANDGIGWRIRYCADHAGNAALRAQRDELLDHLRALIALTVGSDDDIYTVKARVARLDAARAAIAKAGAA